MSISQRDIKLLWGRAASRCSICRIELSQDNTAGSASFPIGEQAHIVGEEMDGPRGSSVLSPDERNSYHNLMLLCPTHHAIIDKNVEDYPVERLYLYKSRHELWVQQSLASNTPIDTRPISDLLRLVDTISPLLLWLHTSVPSEHSLAFIRSLHTFWTTYSMATEMLDSELLSGLDHFLRPLAAGERRLWADRPYARAKLGIASQILESYFKSRGFDWIDWDSAEAIEIAQIIKGNLERIASNADQLSNLEEHMVRHMLFLAKYYESYWRAHGHTQVPESLVQQFFATFDHLFCKPFGFRLPDPLDEASLDIIEQLCRRFKI